MLKKIFLIVLLFSASFHYSQSGAILTPDSKLIPVDGNVREVIEGTKLIPHYGKHIKNVIVSGKPSYSKETYDTLSVFEQLNLARNVNFGFFSQDIMVQWYVAPADMYIKAIGFTVLDASGFENGDYLKLLLVKTDLTEEEIKGLLVNGEPTCLGHYASDSYMNDKAPFPWWGSGEWIPCTEGIPEIWTEDIWSDFGDGYPITEVQTSGDEIVYNWVVLNDALGYEPELITRGEVFGIAIQHGGLNPAQPDEERIGFIANKVGVPHPGFKYYSMGRNTDDGNWWSREYTWDFVAAVEFLFVPPPRIGVTQLNTTLSTEPREVTATVISEYETASASLLYSVDEMATWNEVTMSSMGNDTFVGTIPGMPPGTHVYYKVRATDVQGNSWEAGPFDYYIFQPKKQNLILCNGYERSDEFLMTYYFSGKPDYLDNFDIWCYGTNDGDIFSHYKNVLEITTKGPVRIYNDSVAAWLAGSGDNNYALFGDEWLGAQVRWSFLPYGPGEFHYDILGIYDEYNDINYYLSGDETRAYPVYPVEYSLLGGEIASALNNSGDTLFYDPYGIYGVANWLDGVVFLDDVEVDFTANVVVFDISAAIGGHRTLSAGNKIVFMGFDPLFLTSDSVWYGTSEISPIIKTCEWFGVPVSVNDNENVATKFELLQNYPNPFNPTTTIKYSIPNNAGVETQDFASLRIYNILGEEIATLVNEKQAPGEYSVQFDASGLPSGVYFYTLRVGDFTATKKMILLK